jgi:hypothetical protein
VIEHVRLWLATDGRSMLHLNVKARRADLCISRSHGLLCCQHARALLE